MKLSLISATSMVALAATAHAYVLTRTPSETSLYELLHDSHGAAAAPDTSATGVSALQATDIAHQQASFTGPFDRAAARGTAFPLVPLGAAPGTSPTEDFATQYAGAWQWDSGQKALAIGMARIAPLIGTIGDGSSANDKPGSTVFVADNSPEFNGGSGWDNRRRIANEFAPSSTSSATITLSGAANTRQRAGSGFSVAAPTDAQPQPVAIQPGEGQPAPVDTKPATPTWRYAPQPNPGTKGNLVAASFSNAITASGAAPQPVQPANSQSGIAPLGVNLLETASIFARMVDVTQPIDGQSNPTGADGTRIFLPASVSANPAAAAARYVMRVLDAARAGGSGPTIETFQIGPTKGSATGGAASSVTDPLQGKIMAGTGPLDNSLALP
jgi:hypothetical protein